MRKNSENNREFEHASGAAAERPAARGAGRSMADFGQEALGRLVRSKAGHDKDTFLVIVAVADEEHVMLADGRLRTVEKPKRKKLRHIEVRPAFSKELHEKLVSKSPVQNAELRNFIAEACAEAEKNQG